MTSRNSSQFSSQNVSIELRNSFSLSIVSGDTVFLFGGRGDLPDQEEEKLSDLHILDMSTMRWKKVHDNVPILRKLPTLMGIRFTFTRVSDSTAILYGEYTSFFVLDLNKAKQLQDPWAIWTQVPHKFPRSSHASVLEPVSQRLWIIGGYIGLENGRITSDILEIPIEVSLKDLAIECAASNIAADDSKLEDGKYPKCLRDEIEAYRSRTEATTRSRKRHTRRKNRAWY